MVRLLLASLLASSLLLAGCAGDEGPGDQTPTETATDYCPGIDASTQVLTWTKHGGEWGAQAAGAGRQDVVCGQADRALSSLVNDLAGPFGNLEANVDFYMLGGDSGAGLVLHFQDEQNFNIVRYSVREQGWHLFTVVEGNRQKQDEASFNPPTTNPDYNEWVSLRVTSQDGHIQAFDGDTKVIDYLLKPEASHTGRVGYFLRDTGMAALFDEFSVLPL